MVVFLVSPLYSSSVLHSVLLMFCSICVVAHLHLIFGEQHENKKRFQVNIEKMIIYTKANRQTWQPTIAWLEPSASDIITRQVMLRRALSSGNDKKFGELQSHSRNVNLLVL